MPGKTPHSNGKQPNGLRSNKDAKGKKPSKDTDEEMTVVVPPSKAVKQSSAPLPADGDGDVDMGGEENVEDGVQKVDPVAQAVAGES